MAKSDKTAQKSKKDKAAKKVKPARVSYHRRPEDMQLDLWQLGLRKQFGEESDFHIANTGSEPVFSEFIVWNPATRNNYTVALRADLPKKGLPPANTLTWMGNSCTCQDFKTNRLGLCKHISAVLHQTRKKRGAKKALKTGYRAPPSAVYVDYRRAPQIPAVEDAASTVTAPDLDEQQDAAVAAPAKPTRSGKGAKTNAAGAHPATPQELIQTGVSFFAGLAQTLNSPEKTQDLVQSIVATDESTGQTYLKIPVENAAVVENAVKLLGGLLAGLGR